MSMFNSSDLIMIDMPQLQQGSINYYYIHESIKLNIITIMGGCFNTKQAKYAIDMPVQYLNDTRSPQGFLIPLETTLFNLMRKPNQLQIIRYSPNKSLLFFKQNAPKLSNLTAKDIKMLYSFKNILLVGRQIDQLSLIKASSNPKQIYCIDQQTAASFVQKFPIFRAGQSTVEPKYLPIYAFNSEEIMKRGSKKQIFIHSQSNQNQKIYPYLRVKQIVQDNPTATTDQISMSIQSCQPGTILFLHSTTRKPDDLLAILSKFATNQYGIAQLNAQIYIRKSLPQTLLNINDAALQPTTLTQPILSKPKQELSLTQTYQKYLQQLYVEMGNNETAKNKVDRAYNLVVTLLSNIYNNKNSQNYRTVRKTNPQVNELLGRYKNGVKLLNEVGFVDKGSGYVNSTDLKYVKIYRTDLDMAYRNFLNQT